MWDVKGPWKCLHHKRKERVKKNTWKNRKQQMEKEVKVSHWHCIFLTETCAFPLEVTTVCVVVPNSQRHLVAAPQMFNNNMKSTFGLTPISFPSLRNPAPVSKGCLLFKCRATGNFPTKTLKLLSPTQQKLPHNRSSLSLFFFFFRAVAWKPQGEMLSFMLRAREELKNITSYLPS